MSSTTAFEKFQQWTKAGFFDRIWEAGLVAYDDFEGIDWRWQSADGCQIKTPLGSEENGAGNNPTDGGKKGRKWLLLTEGNGVPIGILTSSANRHDSRLLASLLESSYVSTDRRRRVFNLCLDAGFVGKEETARKFGYIPHIRSRGDEKKIIEESNFTARR